MPEKVHPESDLLVADGDAPLKPGKQGPRVVVLEGDGPEAGNAPRVRIKTGHSNTPFKEYEVCRYALGFVPIHWRARQAILAFIEWKWFDRFILFLIAVISLLSAAYEWRAPADRGFNFVVSKIIEPIVNGFFIAEMILKVLGWGFVCHRGAYLRSPWNWLDFVVVIDAILEYLPFVEAGQLNFLRLFRALRPLRSLNAVPQMKVLVNTIMVSIPKLGNVTMLGAFLFGVFGIIGITLMDGVFYHRCRTTPNPTFDAANSCWVWEYAADVDRLCGGMYSCPSGTYCGGHEADPSKDLRPDFGANGMDGYSWCAGSEPTKLHPETDFIHFDHIGGAVLVVFQCMTLEGWTDIMYWVQDGYSEVPATLYFCLMICITSHFLLNVALAVVDEVRDSFAEEELENQEDTGEESMSPKADEREEEDEVWWDIAPVRFLHSIATSEIFLNAILFFIIGNVVTMMLEKYPLEVSWKDFLDTAEIIFLVVFCVEMVIMIAAHGPIRYATNPVTAFDGVIVIISVIQAAMGQAGPLTALRTLRLFRVLNKLQDRWHSLKVLLKAMLHTGMSLNYWLVLFMLVLYIFTLIALVFFNRKFHFDDPDAFDRAHDGNAAWCPDIDQLPIGQRSWHYWQDCIPRAHFDTFLWSFTTIFQIMTGENWNTVMYAGMRATHWISTLFFWFLIIFGQTLFLSLFLSILTSKFQEVNEHIAKVQEAKRMSKMNAFKHGASSLRLGFLRAQSEDSVADGIRRRLGTGEDSQGLTPVAQEAVMMMLGRGRGAPKRVDVRPKNTSSLPGQVDAEDGQASRQEKEGETKAELVKEGAAPAPPGDVEKNAEGVEELAESPKWPRGYAWFVLSRGNPVRVAANKVLNFQATIKGEKIKVFDNFILLCILLSTVCMMIDFPLRDPDDTLTKIVRTADTVFAIIFIIEMVVKLVALGLIWGPDAYLKSGWNWLDSIVVTISIIDFVSSGSGGFLKTMRILRAFRPLRVISRNENLKVVVQTIFASVPDLATLVVVSSLFLLIFALVCLSYLNGRFYHCPGSSGLALLRDIGDLRTPLCVAQTAPDASSPLGTSNTAVASPNGAWNRTSNTWDMSSCATGFQTWSRATVDTPICIGRCDPMESAETAPPSWLCPARFASTEELPPVGRCLADTSRQLTQAEQRGMAFTEAMKRALVMPCGGSTVVNGALQPSAGSAASCRQIFCPQGASADVRDSCRSNCRKEPEFCVEACKHDRLSQDDASLSPGCSSCLSECEAACECRDFCEPLIKDAALCHEQGDTWSHALSQNFDNIFSSLLTLFEISTTEGWVDVMYWAADSTDTYVQPKRDNLQWLWAPFFVFYIFFMTMFLINLSVGIIVERFFELQKRPTLMTDKQELWVKSQLSLGGTFFTMTNLHELPRLRRKVYNLVMHKYFERGIMAAIVFNTLLMALKIFPAPVAWWNDALSGMNYFFFGVFLLEACLKIFALLKNYFKDNWNLLDFVCVVAGIVSLVLRAAFEVDIVALSGVVRIFRIGRLFRLMRQFKDVNKIFMALIKSLPKLANVMGILLLVLTLYGILGVSLFSTAKKPADGTLDAHGNFDDFWKAFVTLFRSSTGEAWNELMHDLSKDERMYYREGDWCSPAELFDTSQKYSVLKDKCLVEEPNACVQDIFGKNIFPVIYWVSYILVCLHLMMNLVIAVILDGYEEGKETPPEQRYLSLCVDRWKEYDPDITQKLPLPKAMRFIGEVYGEIVRQERGDQAEAARRHPNRKQIGADFSLSRMPMHYAKCFDLKVQTGGQVGFRTCAKQVLRLVILEGQEDTLGELEASRGRVDKKTNSRLSFLDKKQDAEHKNCPSLIHEVAASKIQERYRKKKRNPSAVPEGADGARPSAGPPQEPQAPQAGSDSRSLGPLSARRPEEPSVERPGVPPEEVPPSEQPPGLQDSEPGEPLPDDDAVPQDRKTSLSSLLPPEWPQRSMTPRAAG